jgi:hypothetical protein
MAYCFEPSAFYDADFDVSRWVQMQLGPSVPREAFLEQLQNDLARFEVTATATPSAPSGCAAVLLSRAVRPRAFDVMSREFPFRVSCARRCFT